MKLTVFGCPKPRLPSGGQAIGSPEIEKEQRRGPHGTQGFQWERTRVVVVAQKCMKYKRFYDKYLDAKNA